MLMALSCITAGDAILIDKIYPGRSINGGAQYYSAVRVEHYDKGAPRCLCKARSQPRVSGSFWALNGLYCKMFQRIGGFEEKFIFGHYEDAKSLSSVERANSVRPLCKSITICISYICESKVRMATRSHTECSEAQ